MFPWCQLIAHNVWLPDAVADLATEFSPLAQNENSKKERTIYRKPAIAFDSGYELLQYVILLVNTLIWFSHDILHVLLEATLEIFLILF